MPIFDDDDEEEEEVTQKTQTSGRDGFYLDTYQNCQLGHWALREGLV